MTAPISTCIIDVLQILTIIITTNCLRKTREHSIYGLYSDLVRRGRAHHPSQLHQISVRCAPTLCPPPPWQEAGADMVWAADDKFEEVKK